MVFVTCRCSERNKKPQPLGNPMIALLQLCESLSRPTNKFWHVRSSSNCPMTDREQISGPRFPPYAPKITMPSETKIQPPIWNEWRGSDVSKNRLKVAAEGQFHSNIRSHPLITLNVQYKSGPDIELNNFFRCSVSIYPQSAVVGAIIEYNYSAAVYNIMNRT